MSGLRRGQVGAVALLFALVVSLAIAVVPAGAESLGPAPIRDLNDGGLTFPAITGPEAPEEYPFHVTLGEEQELRQISFTEVGVFDSGTGPSMVFTAEAASDADGATVPTTLALTAEETITLTVHHREGNPAAGWAPFDYPVMAGSGWPRGFRTVVVVMENPLGGGGQKVVEANAPAPTPTCKVPSLRGYSLRGAKNRLRAAHCGIGAVHLAAGATASKGKVVKQFRRAGTELSAGAPVAVKLGASASR